MRKQTAQAKKVYCQTVSINLREIAKEMFRRYLSARIATSHSKTSKSLSRKDLVLAKVINDVVKYSVTVARADITGQRDSRLMLPRLM